MWSKLLYRFFATRAKWLRSKAVETAPLVIATVFKDEAPFLKEWLDFHLAQGVERFYLADNRSNDQPLTVLQPYIEKGQVVLFQTRSAKMNAFIQAKELNLMLSQIGRQLGADVWVAVIDVDEFLFNPDSLSIQDIIAQRKGQLIAAVLVNWMMFGTSNLPDLDPEQSMLSQLTWRAHESLGEHRMVKPILYLANTNGFYEGPHRPFPRGAARFVQADGSLFQEEHPAIVHHPLRINHYWYRSEAYYNRYKRAKRRAFGDERSGKREADHIKACNYEQDETILRLTNMPRNR